MAKEKPSYYFNFIFYFLFLDVIDMHSTNKRKKQYINKMSKKQKNSMKNIESYYPPYSIYIYKKLLYDILFKLVTIYPHKP
jgi:hypothetical protein